MRFLIIAFLTMLMAADTSTADDMASVKQMTYKPPVVSTMAEEISDKSIHVTDSEYNELLHLVMAEAGSEPLEGKEMVVAVVLNRVESEKFPNSIDSVVMQNHQFSCVSDGRFYSAEPTEECRTALDLVLSGEWDYSTESQGALWFERKYNVNTWHSQHLTELFVIGHHTFYR